MKRQLYIGSWLIFCWLLCMPLRLHAQTDTTNVWFSNGPSGLLIVQDVVVNPNFSDTLFAGSLGSTVTRSLNRGNTWTEVGSAIADSILALAIASSNTATIYAGTLNRGVYKSTDHGSTWAATGLTGLQINAVSVDPNNANRVYAGTPDSLMRSTDGGTNWSLANLDSVNVTSIVMHPQMPDTVLVGTDGRGVFRTFNDATTWFNVNNGLSSFRISEVVIHPTQSDTVYSATQGSGVFRSTDGATSWGAVNNGLTGFTLSSLSFAPSDPAVLYAGTSTGQVFKSADHAGIWSDITRNFPAGVPVLALAVHPDSANVVYAATGPITGAGVQRLKQTGLGAVASVTAGNRPGALTVADFNGDGVSDVVAGNAGENDLSVYLTASLGAVLARTDFRVGSEPVSTHAADLDGDNDIDLVAANQTKNTVSVLFNDSTGVFGAANDLFANGPVGNVSLTDVDGDGDVDIVAADGVARALLIFRNDGAGSFEAPEIISTVSGISDLGSFDFSGDGIPDLVVLSHLEGRLALFTNRGNGTYVDDPGNSIGTRPAHLAWSDFDADGDIDIATSTGDARVLVFANNNGFDRGSPVSYSLADTASALVAADLDLDQYPDLLAPRATGEVAVLVNDGNGAFSTSLSFGTIAGSGDAAVADLNSDGQLDIVVAVPSVGSLTLFANSVAPAIKSPAPPQGVTAVDAQGDLGGVAHLAWKRPRRDESTGRILAYRILRALGSSNTFSEIARIDTSTAHSVDSFFVYRSYLDSNATVGLSYSYYLVSEGSGAVLSMASDTVSVSTLAQPFFDFSFSDNSPYHVLDTIVATVRLNLVGHDVQSFSMFMGMDTAAVEILDRDSSIPGIQPLAVDAVLANDARVLQNRIDPLDSTRVDFGLGFLPTLADSIPVTIGTMHLVARKDTTTIIQVLNDTSAARQTVLTDRSSGALIQPFVPTPSKLIFRNFRLRGSVAFQGRQDDLSIPVRFDLTQNNAMGTALTTAYVAPNDEDLNVSGAQVTLDSGGNFALEQIQVGKYSLFAKAFHYLRGRVATDSVVVTDTTGVASLATFKFVSADSALQVSELRGGDANNDNRVDLADFGALASHFGESGFAENSTAWGADFNGDGIVNLADFALLQSNFGEVGMGSAIAAKPVVLATQVKFEEGRVYVADADGMMGVSIDILGEVDKDVISTSEFWGEDEPVILMRDIPNGVRIAAVAPNAILSGTGPLFDLPSLDDVRLERIRILSVDGILAWAAGAYSPVEEAGPSIPEKPELYANYPNPFNPSTTIPFAVSASTYVVLTIYSPLGQVVRTLVSDVLPPGVHQHVWDGRDNTGRLVASGLYIIQLVQDDFVATRKTLLIK